MSLRQLLSKHLKEMRRSHAESQRKDVLGRRGQQELQRPCGGSRPGVANEHQGQSDLSRMERRDGGGVERQRKELRVQDFPTVCKV